MAGGGKVPMEIWKIILLSAMVPIFWPVLRNSSVKFGWTAVNYKNMYIPFTLGIVLLLFVFNFILLWPPDHLLAFMVYIVGIWTAGWIDDVRGSDYPKGIKGHMYFFIKKGEWTTGLTKIVIIVISASVSLLLAEATMQIGTVITFMLFVLSPHVCNSLDTRPLRVWKWVSIHVLMLLIFLSVRPVPGMLFYIVVAMGVWGYLEITKKGMLGDNGAALAGGIIAWVGMQFFPFSIQLFFMGILVGITYLAEKISIHAFIEKVHILKEIDHLGRRERME